MPSTNHSHSRSHSHSHSHSHSRTDAQTGAHKPHASKKPTSSTTKPIPAKDSQSKPPSSPLPPQTTSKSQHDNNITDIVPPSSSPTSVALTIPPPTTEATLCASIRLQSRLADLLETARLFVEFDEGTKNSEAYYDLTYFYHRELKHSVVSVLRALHQLADRVAEGLESAAGDDGEDVADESIGSEGGRKTREAKLLSLVPEAAREACLAVEREIGEVRERRKGSGWKELGREGRRAAWRAHCERLVSAVEGSRGAREREVEGLRGELRGEVRRLVRRE